MKKIVFIISLIFFYVSNLSLQAQSTPYKNSIGGTVGFINGVSYKGFTSQNFALQVDGGIGYSYPYFSTKFNVNFMYENYIKMGFYWFAGVGVSIGNSLVPITYDFNKKYNLANMGFNLMGGAEYKFAKLPLTLQADMRPGMSVFFMKDTPNEVHFDYNFLTLSARYTF